MHILVVAATPLEIPRLASGACGGHTLHVLVTGVGMVATAAHCARALSLGRYDLAYNFGVCGSFDPAFPPGTVVHVTSDRLSELGAEDGDRFLPIEELGLNQTGVVVNDTPPANRVLAELPRVRAITVNAVHGADASIAAVRARWSPQVESMEGAAFAYACALHGVPYAQVRAVSNMVERRNRQAWRLDDAIQQLNEVAVKILEDASC
jgi:futalosine hydrolase